jgi:hypothetical protein
MPPSDPLLQRDAHGLLTATQISDAGCDVNDFTKMICGRLLFIEQSILFFAGGGCPDPRRRK